MENTLENKAKFFAQYYGQKVMKVDDLTYPNLNKLYHTVGGLNIYNLQDGRFICDSVYLQLKPLSQISDEDLEGIYPHGSEAFFIYYGNGNKELAVDRFLYKFQLQPEYIDFLRLRGYAVPWAGLSVEKQQEYGWIKLTETAIK